MASPTTEQQAKFQELKDIIKSDPALFLSMAAGTTFGRRLIDAIKTSEIQKHLEGSKQDQREISDEEVLNSLAALDNSTYRRDRETWNKGEMPSGPLDINLPFQSLVTLVEYARQKLIQDDPNLYVLQDSRTMADDKMLFWSRNAQGYTTDLSKAHRFTEAEAKQQQASRETDIPHRVGDLSPATPSMLAAAASKQVQQSRKHVSTTPGRFDQEATKPVDANSIGTLELEERFAKIPRGVDTPVLISRRADDQDKVDSILVDPPAYLVSRLEQDDQYVCESTNLATLASRFWAIPNVQDTLSYYNWQLLSDFMAEGLGSMKAENDELTHEFGDRLVSDMPERIVVKRLDLFDRHATPASTPGKMRLVDLTMAARYGEPVNERLFTNETFNQPDKSWRAQVEEGDFGELAQWADSNQHDLDQIKLELEHLSKSTEFTTDIERADRREELIFTRDCLLYEMEEIALLDDQIHSHMIRTSKQVEQAALIDDLDLDNEEPTLRMG